MLYLENFKTTKKAFEYIEKAAEQELKEAQNNLGCMYEKKKYGPKNLKDLKRKLKQLKRKHNILQNTPSEDELRKAIAIEWYIKAAEQGDYSAQYNLGVIYKDKMPDKAASYFYHSYSNELNNNQEDQRDSFTELKRLKEEGSLQAEKYIKKIVVKHN